VYRFLGIGVIMFELFDPEADFRITHGTRLPHWYQPGASYFVTFRTEDSMPVEVSRLWHARRSEWLAQHGISPADVSWSVKLNQLSLIQRKDYHERFSKEYFENLDKGYGACVLKRQELSRKVADSLLYFNGDRYHMGDFVVMPNHVHLIVCLLGTTDIVKQCTSWKRFTAKEINQHLNLKGRFWQEDSFDHLIRSDRQFDAIRRYIGSNPTGLKQGEYFLYRFDESLN
jgi:putative transposase